MAELDKFKRRMIRSVARMLLHENRPEDELWDALRKESGCDCKLLWQRMRALTIKKLDRLLAADDKPEQVAAVARLTPTDWLLCDLILVHEHIDLIGLDTHCRKRDPVPLVTLYDLVCTHNIEELSRSLQRNPTKDNARKLAEAWTAVTAEYNDRPTSGYRSQCSAMLMQKRWYQLKKASRESFYNLWWSYRGNAKLWDSTEKIRPTKLQASVAQRFPHIVTSPFLEWGDQINAGLVILPKEYDDMLKLYSAQESQNTESQADGDDLVVLEPQIETIDLGDSDSEEAGPSNQPSVTPTQPDEDSNSQPGPSRHISETAHKYADSNPNSNESVPNDVDMDDTPDINDEPVDGLSNVKILQATHIPIQDITDFDPTVKIKSEINIKEEPVDPSDPAVKRHNLSLAMDKYLESTSSLDTTDENDDLIREKANQYFNKPTVTQVSKETETTGNQQDASDINDDLIREKANKYLNKPSQVSKASVSQVSSDNVIDDGNDDSLLITTDVIRQRADAYIKQRLHLAFLKDSSESSDDLIQEKTDAFLKNTKTDSFKSKKPSTTIPIEDNVQEIYIQNISDDLIKATADTYLHKKGPLQYKEKLFDRNKGSEDLIKTKTEEYVHKTKDPKEKLSKEGCDAIIKKKAEEFVRHADFKKLVLNVKTECESEIADVKTECVNETENETANDLFEGMEIVDDGIEYFDDYEDDIIKLNIDFPNRGEQTSEAQPVEHTEEQAPASYDLKLLMEPVVYTLKLDQMSVFNHKTFLHVDDSATIDKALEESKPVSEKALKDMKSFNEESNVSNEKSNPNKKDESSNLSLVDKIDQSDVNLDNQDIVRCVENKMNEFLAKTGTRKRFVGPKSMNKQNWSQFDTSSDNNRLKFDTGDTNSNDNDDYGIPDEIKVKTSSYLLRKPRKRNYNPILLCKNPDFNTRLRRLTVGFFAYHNNRMLLKELKPMTIDLSKAFETKLVNGTLYLKSGDGETPPQETQAEHENVQTVKPSTSSVQSLIDNSIETYKKQVRNPTVPTVDLTGRDKRINLKDINEIRQINQKLQTAQVTPIRMEVDDSIREPPKEPEQPKSVEQPIKGPVNVVPDVQSGNNADIPTTSSITHMNDKEARLAAKEIMLTTQLERQKPVGKKYYKPVHIANAVIGPQRIMKVNVPWNKPYPNNMRKADDLLITDDTLSKMIVKVKGLEELVPPKKKGKNWKYYPREKERRDEKKRAEAALKKARDEEAMEKEATQIAKDDTEHADAATDDSTNYETTEGKKSTNKKYCCWAKEKAVKRLTRSKIYQKHNCKGLCECCCRDMLLTMAIRKPETVTRPSKKVEKGQHMLAEHTELENACQTIEDVVQESSATLQPRPHVRIVTGKHKDLCTKTDTAPQLMKAIGTTHDVRGLPMEVASVNDRLDCTSYTYKCVTSRETSTRIVVLEPPEHFFIRPSCGAFKVTVHRSTQTDDFAYGDSPILANTVPLHSHTTSIALTQVPVATNPIPLVPVPELTPIYPRPIANNDANRNPLLIRRLTTHQKQIVIDGTGIAPKLKPNIVEPILEVHTEKNSKMVYLSSKTIAKEPTGLPIYLGKNKVLLTTVKFPSNLGKSEATASTDQSPITVHEPTPLDDNQPKAAVIPAVSTEALPPGVQLVLPTNGELTYILDSGIVLNTQELENLAHIISSVKEQIETSQVMSEAHCQIIETKSDTGNNITVSSEPVTDGEPTCQTNEMQTDVNLIETKSNAITIDIEPEIPEITNKDSDTGEGSQNPSLSSENPKDPEETIGKGLEHQNAPMILENPKESEVKAVNLNQTFPEQHKDPEEEAIAINKEPQNETLTSENQQETEVKTIDVDQETQKDSEEVEIIEDGEKHPDDTGRGNLLMDLMAMSGISAEDVKVEEQSPTKAFPVHALTLPTKTNLAEEVLESNLPELTPVTSLAELKYACDHNGKFFKLDFVTGVLVSINVCIKKTKVKKSPCFYVSNPTDDSVIDLTDDPEELKERKKDPDFNYRLVSPVARNVRSLRQTRTRTSSPLVLNKHLNPSVFTRLEKRTVPLNSTSTTPVLPLKRKRGRPRKQDLKIIEAKIDIVDSDAPMEEEYLLDSDSQEVIESPLNDPEKRALYYKQIVHIEKKQLPESSSRSLLKPIVSANSNDSEESSDDEPLASKAKKIHVRHSVSIINEKNANLEESDQQMEYAENDRSPEYPEPTEDEPEEDIERSPEYPEPTEDEPEEDIERSPEYPEPTEDEPTEDMEMDIDEENTFEPTILENCNGETDDDDGDCILGV